MTRYIVLILLLGVFPAAGQAQEEGEDTSDVVAITDPQPSLSEATDPGYKINPAVDIPVTAIGAGWSAFAFTKIYGKDPSTPEQILSLNKDDLNSFDRWAAGKHNKDADKASNYLFYGSIPLPFLLLADKEIRRDAPKVGFMYLEAMAITGLLYTGGDYFVDRYRPEAYATDLPVDERQNGNAKNSFFAGHVALVATTTFFTAQVYSDYHPHSKLRWFLYGGAVVATGTTIYLRHIAGKHFPTDIVVGTAVGTLSGLLVPILHRNRQYKERGWGLEPSMNLNGGYGVSFRYRF